MTQTPDGAGLGSDAALARQAADAAGAALLELRREGGDDLRARGDALGQATLSELLARHRPQDAVLSEEAVDDPARLAAQRVWIIDPLDGTREYGEGDRHDWAVHVALWERGELAAAAVALPAVGQTLSTDRPVPVPAQPGATVRLAVSRSRATELALGVADDLGAQLVPLGSAGYKVCAVLRGEADAYLHSGGQYEWDSAAPVAVARAAGLHTSRIDGSALQPAHAVPARPVGLPPRARRAGARPGGRTGCGVTAATAGPGLDAGELQNAAQRPGYAGARQQGGNVVDVEPVRTGREVSDVPGVPVPRTVAVDRFTVCDQTLADTVADIVQGAVATAGSRPYVAFALHVGGLNTRTDAAYRAAMDAADLVYADGVSVVLLARLAGARELQRAGTTDLGWDVLRGLSRQAGPPGTGRAGRRSGRPGRAGRTGAHRAGRRPRGGRRARLPPGLVRCPGAAAGRAVRRARRRDGRAPGDDLGAPAARPTCRRPWCSPAAAGSASSPGTSGGHPAGCKGPGWSGRTGWRRPPADWPGRYALGALTTARLAGSQLGRRPHPPTARPPRGGRR